MPKSKNIAALAARLIRSELKKNKIIAKVTSDGEDISIVLDNPAPIEINKVIDITRIYKLGSYNHILEYFEDSNRIDGLPQVKSINVSEDYDPEHWEAVFSFYKEDYKGTAKIPASWKQGTHVFIEEEMKPLDSILYLILTGQHRLSAKFWRYPAKEEQKAHLPTIIIKPLNSRALPC